MKKGNILGLIILILLLIIVLLHSRTNFNGGRTDQQISALQEQISVLNIGTGFATVGTGEITTSDIIHTGTDTTIKDNVDTKEGFRYRKIYSNQYSIYTKNSTNYGICKDYWFLIISN